MATKNATDFIFKAGGCQMQAESCAKASGGIYFDCQFYPALKTKP